jgi:hypothetical protein
MQVLRFAAPPHRAATKQFEKMENDMTSKLTAIVAAAAVLASAGVASAQTSRNGRVQWHAPYTNSYYYNYDTRNLRYGHANDFQFDSYAGTR